MSDLKGRQIGESYDEVLTKGAAGTITDGDDVLWFNPGTKINYTDIVNDLTTGGSGVPGSAENDKVLNETKAAGFSMQSDTSNGGAPVVILLGKTTETNRISGIITGSVGGVGGGRDTLQIEISSLTGVGGSFDPVISYTVNKSNDDTSLSLITCTYSGETYFGLRISGPTAFFYPATYEFVGRTPNFPPEVVLLSNVSGISSYSGNVATAQKHIVTDELYLNGQSINEQGIWTPSDNSGAGLTFSNVDCSYIKVGNFYLVSFRLSFPATADGNLVSITGTPANPIGTTYAFNGALSRVGGTSSDVSGYRIMVHNTGNRILIKNSSGFITNSQASETLFMGTYAIISL